MRIDCLYLSRCKNTDLTVIRHAAPHITAHNPIKSSFRRQCSTSGVSLMELGHSCQSVSCTSPLYCNDLSGSVLRPRPNLNVHLLQVFTTLSLQTKWIKTAQQASSSGVGRGRDTNDAQHSDGGQEVKSNYGRDKRKSVLRQLRD